MIVNRICVTLAALCLMTAVATADDPKSYKLTVDGVAVAIDPGDTVEMTLPSGKHISVKLERNEFSTFSGEAFSFVHASDTSIAKTALSFGTQYLMGSALGNYVIVQEYSSIDPTSLNALMLHQVTNDLVKAGGKLTEATANRKLADGMELTGLAGTVKSRSGSDSFEVFSCGRDERGVVVVTHLGDQNVEVERKMIDEFWKTLRIKL